MQYPYNIRPDYGFFHPYSFFMSVGMAAVALLSVWQLRRRGIKINWVWCSLGMAIVILVGMLGGSWSGKIWADIPWYKKFEFWNLSGGMGIYGAILFGAGAFFVYFGVLCRREKVSLWALADAIVPNILLAQAIGRWGNFFNHEILGGREIPRDSLSWLPKFIADNCRNEDNLLSGMPRYHAPLFLYESIGTFVAWFLLTFVVARLGEWIGPTRHDLAKLPRGLYEQRRSWRAGLKFWVPRGQFNRQITPRQLWLRDYFHYQPTLQAVKSAPPGKLYRLYNPHQFVVVRAGVSTGLYFVLWNLVRVCITPLRQPFNFYTRLSGYNYFESEDIVATPQQIGVELSFMLAIMGVALLLVVLAQTNVFCRWRRAGYVYEKPYLDLSAPENWQLERYFGFFVTNGIGNQARSFLRTVTSFISWTLGERISASDLNLHFRVIKFNCYADRAEDVTLRAVLVLQPTAAAVKKWGFASRSFVWHLRQRLDLRRFKRPLQQFVKRWGVQRMVNIVNMPAYQAVLRAQLQLRFCHNSTNLLPFAPVTLNRLAVVRQKVVITPTMVHNSPLFRLNHKLILAVQKDK